MALHNMALFTDPVLFIVHQWYIYIYIYLYSCIPALEMMLRIVIVADSPCIVTDTMHYEAWYTVTCMAQKARDSLMAMH